MRALTILFVSALASIGHCYSSNPHTQAKPIPNISLWNLSEPEAAAQLQRIHQAWTQMISMTKIILYGKIPRDTFNVTYNTYFLPEDRQRVEKVFMAILGTADKTREASENGSPALRHVSLVNYDIGDDDPCRQGRYIWLRTTPDHPHHTQLRVCEKGWKYPLLNETSCDDLGDRVTGQMSSLPGLLMLEILQYPGLWKKQDAEEVGKIDLSQHRAIGPTGTRWLRQSGTPTTHSADQYRWFAQESYWAFSCSKTYDDPVDKDDNIEPYGQ